VVVMNGRGGFGMHMPIMFIVVVNGFAHIYTLLLLLLYFS